jgi:YegS/Rv2252/BmrU family lipid kinase
MSRSVLVIINPTSGSTAGSAQDGGAKKLELRFAEHDYHPEVRLTTQQGDAHDWAMVAKDERFDCVAVVGGDGTIMEVISGMLTAKACLPLLVLPAGTGNLLARTLHVPEDPVAALDALLKGETRALDVGYIKNKGRYFIVAAGAGVDADTMRDANQGSKARLGRRAYLLAILRNLFKRRVVEVTLGLDGAAPVRLRAHSVLVFNASELDVGPLRVGPGVTPHNGKLEVAVLRGVNVWSFIVDAWHLLTHKLRHRRAPDSYSVQSVYIDTKPPLLTQADGDVLGDTPLDIEVLPQAIEVVVPQAYIDYLDPDKNNNLVKLFIDTPIADVFNKSA